MLMLLVYVVSLSESARMRIRPVRRSVSPHLTTTARLPGDQSSYMTTTDL